MLRHLLASTARTSAHTFLSKPSASTAVLSFRSFYPKNSTPNRTLTGKRQPVRDWAKDESETSNPSSSTFYQDSATMNKDGNSSWAGEKKGGRYESPFWLSFDVAAFIAIAFCYYTLRKNDFKSAKSEEEKTVPKPIYKPPMITVDKATQMHSSFTFVHARLPHVAGTPEFKKICDDLSRNGINVEESFSEKGQFAFSYTVKRPTRGETIQEDKEKGVILNDAIHRLQELDKAAAQSKTAAVAN